MAELQSIVDVTAVRVLSRYIIEVEFEDGAVKVMDLEPVLWGDAFEALRGDYDHFCAVRVDPDAGTIVWPNGADVSPRMLYEKGRSAIPHPAGS